MALLGIGQAQAQVRLYTFGQSNGTYTPITGGTVAAVNVVSGTDPYPGPTDDVVLAAVTIPFSFTFNGVAYTTTRISSNGFLTFGTTAPTAGNVGPISSAGGYAGAVSPMGSDLAGNHVAGNLGEIRYETMGSSPNRTFVVQWSNFARLDPNTFQYSNDIINFQVRLNETSNTINFVYNAAAVAAGLTTNPQVGLRGASNADYNSRTSLSSWSATTTNNPNIGGSSAAAGVFLASSVKPASGLTFTYTPPVACTAPPAAGAAAAFLPNGCGTVSSTVYLVGAATGTGVTYQWQQASAAGGPYTNVASAGTNATYAASGITAPVYYQAIVTCSGQSATSAPVVVTPYAATPAPYATLPYTESFESWTGRCGNLEVPGTNWRATPITGNNSWRRNDQGFSTAGWSYLVNEPAPYQTPSSQGSYSARFHTYGTTSGTQGSLNLYADLSAAGTKTLTFDYVNPTRDNTVERLEVLLSTDGGVTFPTTLLTLTTSSTFSGQSVTFPASSATSVIRFRATSDFGSDDLGIDNLRLEVTPACPGVAFSPTTAITSTAATINFAAVTGATSYTVNYSPGGTAQTVTNANPVTLSGLSPYTNYTVTVTTNCGGDNGTSTTSFRTAIGNDECAGAVALTPGAAGDPCTGATYTTTGATASSLVTSPCNGVADDDVWFSFVATGPRHSITVTPTFNFDAALELRSGASCPGTSQLCQNASANGGPSGTETMVATGLTMGTRYYVRVYNALTGSGSADFDICVTTPADLPCEEVTNLATSGITATSASVTFDPSGGALNYSVTATPTTGAAVSTTVAGSPLTLSGLSPGTTYTLRVETSCLNGGASTAAVTTFTTTAAVANDNCATATALTPGAPGATCATPTVGTTVNATPGAAGCSTGSTADDDVWYSFVATSTAHTITVTGAADFDAVVELRTGSCASSTIQTCRDNTLDGAAEVISATALTVGTTYYVRVYDWYEDVYGSFTICVTTPATPPAPPANDNCAGATSLTPGAAGAACGTPTSGTTVAATASGPAVCSAGADADDDVWYSFVATATSHIITVAGGTGFDPVVDLRTGTCAASTNVACRDNTFDGETETLTATGLTVGITYFVRVYDYFSGITGTFTICVTTPGAPPANDNCAGATSLTPGAVGAACATPTSGTTVAATASGPAVCSAGADADDDVWYSFVATATSHVVTVTSTLDMVVDLRTGTCAASTNVACRDDLFSGAEVLTATGLTVGTTYFVRVYDYDSGNYGAFTICVTTPGAAPANDNCGGAVSLTPGAAGAGCVTPTNGTTVSATASGPAVCSAGANADDDVWYSFVATATSHTVTVVGATGFDAVLDLRTGTCAASTNLSCADNSLDGGTETLLATGLTVGSTYLVRVYDYYATTYGTFTICVTTPGSPPANDNCSGATALTVQAGGCTTPTTGTNVDATDSGVADPACSSYLGGDVWYSFVVPTGGAVTVETGQGSGTSLSDTGLALYTGTCGNLTEVFCDDDAGTGAFSLITATGLTPGATVYARVFAYDNAEFGTFTICASSPGNLTVSTVQSASGTYNNVTVQNGGVLSMNGNLTVTGTVTVQSGGTLNTNCTNTILGSANFVLAAGGTLEVCNPIGLVAGSTTGFLRTTGTRSFSDDANYVYDGTQAQVTGPALPARVRNLTVNNIFGLTLSQATSVAQVARLQSGSLATGGNAFTLLSSASGTALVDNSGGSVTGAGTMQRAITGGVSGPAYRHFSAPVSNTTVNDLSTTGFAPVVNPNYNSAAEPNNVTPFPTVFGYDESRIATVTSTYGAFDKGWFSPANLAAAMTPSRGYTVNAPATATPIDFVGTFNNAAQGSGALSRGTDPQAGYHLLGNPYPSPLDWSTVGAGQRPGVDATMYVYQSTGRYTGTFRTFTNGVGGGSSLIDAGSGYFVHVSAAGTPGAVNLTNANRITTWGTQPAFGRGAADSRPQLQLQVNGTAGLTDLAYLYFENGATANVDAEYDGVKLPNTTGLNLASLAGGEALAINGLPSLAGSRETVVPLTLATPAAGTYTFEVAGLTNFGTTTVYLRDNLTGAQQLLTAGGTYRFVLSTAMAAQRRFSLAFRPAGALATAPAFEAGLVSVYPNPAHGKFTVQLPPVAGQREVQAALLNVLGQTVTTRTIALTAAGASAEFETAALAKGVYLLRLTAGPHTVTQRVVVE